LTPSTDTNPDVPIELNTRWWRGAARASVLRCPRCGQGAIFRRLFFINVSCASCGLTFDRGVGYWLGAMMFNMAFGFAAVVVAILLTLWATSPDPNWDLMIFVAIGAGIVAPVLFFPFSRAFWIAAERAARLRDGTESE